MLPPPVPSPLLPDLTRPRPSRRTVLQALALGAGAAVVAAACGRGETPSVSVMADVARADAPVGNAGPAVKAIDALAADLYAKLAAADRGNLIFSPYSIEIALAMTRNGAVGETRAQMDRVLHAPPGDQLDRGLNALDRVLASRNGERTDDRRTGTVSLDVANALWAQKDLAFEQAFLNALGKDYGAGVNAVDYKTDAAGAQKQINQWVSDKTHAKITDLIPDGLLDALTRLVLTNALYLKAPWLEKFGKMGDQPFHKADGSTSPVPTMIGGRGGRYGEGDGWRGASIPYLGEQLSMVVIVPDDLAAFERDLTGDAWATAVAAVADELESVQLPTFTFRSKFSLAAQLQALGMPLPFTDDADFSAMTKQEQLKIAAVVHQGYIAVDEEGTEAAAATAVVMEVSSARVPTGKKLVVDRPFLFAIRDDETGATLFLGRVADPAAS